MSAEGFDTRTTVMMIGIIVPNVLTLILFCLSKWEERKQKRKNEQKNSSETLFKIQSISFASPFLEDRKFIKGWNKYRNSYLATPDGQYDFSSEENIRYQQYELYCEMIFNFASERFHQLKESEKALLDEINFKSWIRIHRDWWKNPLEEHSNNDTYEEPFKEMIDKWVRS